MNRQEHIAWARDRALAYVDQGDVAQAWASLVSDLGKHPTAGHAAIELGGMQLLAGQLDTPDRMRAFIEGVR